MAASTTAFAPASDARCFRAAAPASPAAHTCISISKQSTCMRSTCGWARIVAGGGVEVEDRLARIEQLLEAVLETTGARQRDGSPLMAVFRNTISAMTDRGGERGSSSFSRGSRGGSPAAVRSGDAPAPAPAPELTA